MSVYLINMKEEYRQVKEDDDEEGQNEDNGQRGEDPQQILQDTQVVLLTETCPFLQCTKQAHLRTRTQRSTHPNSWSHDGCTTSLLPYHSHTISAIHQTMLHHLLHVLQQSEG